MFRRIELINSYKDKETGLTESYKHGLLGISRTEVVDAWIEKLRGSERTLPNNSRFYFTEKGWREVGRHVVTACQQVGQNYRVIRIKENAIDVVWRDKHTGYEVAGQPKRKNMA